MSSSRFQFLRGGINSSNSIPREYIEWCLLYLESILATEEHWNMTPLHLRFLLHNEESFDRFFDGYKRCFVFIYFVSVRTLRSLRSIFSIYEYSSTEILMKNSSTSKGRHKFYPISSSLLITHRNLINKQLKLGKPWAGKKITDHERKHHFSRTREED